MDPAEKKHVYVQFFFYRLQASVKLTDLSYQNVKVFPIFLYKIHSLGAEVKDILNMFTKAT